MSITVKKIKLLKIILLYIVCFGYIWLSDILKINTNQFNNYKIIINNSIQLLFYMIIIILICLLSQDKINKLIDTIFLFIPAMIFIFSRFIIIFNIHVYNNFFGEILRNLMLHNAIYSFVGISILSSIILKYIKKNSI